MDTEQRPDTFAIMDTTLRDGEQTSGVSFSDNEKLSIAKLLLSDVRVDRIEIASARVSSGEFNGAKKVLDWARGQGISDKVEILGFVDGKISLDWIVAAGGTVLNLLCKGSKKHCEEQLRKSPEQHLSEIKTVIQHAKDMGIKTNVYLEDWSNGMRHSRDYVFYMADGLRDLGIGRLMLPDTLGILNPDEAYEFCSIMLERYPQLGIDFHAHNDYDLAVANVYAAIKAGIRCTHTTVNGLGERAGNTPLSSVVAVVKDQLKLQVSVNESKLNLISKMVESLSGIRIPGNKPLIGDYVFTQCSGIHADGDNKNNLYFNDLIPERFGRTRKYALGKTSGRANTRKNLEDMGINLEPEALKKVTEKIIELSDRKETVTAEDLPYIISDVLKSQEIDQRIRIHNYSLTHTLGLKPVANLSIDIAGKRYEEYSSGDGQYDAFVNAIRKIYKRLNRPMPRLADYSVTIPPGGKTDALVETVITWKGKRDFKTRGLDPDQTSAAIKATMKMLNLIDHDPSLVEL
jgi:(R)-citramalate synthase